MFYKWMDKTHHKTLLPSNNNIVKNILNLRILVLLVILFLIVPAFLAQSEINFIYGMGDHPENTRAGEDAADIEEAFGKFTPMVLLVQKEDLARENELTQELNDLEDVKSTVSYTNTV